MSKGTQQKFLSGSKLIQWGTVKESGESYKRDYFRWHLFPILKRLSHAREIKYVLDKEKNKDELIGSYGFRVQFKPKLKTKNKDLDLVLKNIITLEVMLLWERQVCVMGFDIMQSVFLI